LCGTYLPIFFFYFSYSEISSSFAVGILDVPECLPVPCEGEDLLPPNEDCTKVGSECKPCSFGRACYGEFFVRELTITTWRFDGSGIRDETLIFRTPRSSTVDHAGLFDFVEMALDRCQGHHLGCLGADTAGPGFAGCLEISKQVLRRGGRSW